MRAAAAAAGWRRAARCVRTAAHRGDTARPSRAVTASSSVARHVRIRMPHQQRRQTRPPQKRTNDSKKEPLQLLWLLAVTPSRKSYPYGRSLNAPPRRVCGPRAVVPKLLRPGCPIEIYMLRLCGPHAERPVHMLTKTRPMSSPRIITTTRQRIITPPKFRGSPHQPPGIPALTRHHLSAPLPTGHRLVWPRSLFC